MLLGLSSHLRRTLLNNPNFYSYRSFGTKIGSSEERLAHTMLQLSQKRAVLQKELAKINRDIANVNMMMGIEETSETAAVFESIEARAQTQLLPTKKLCKDDNFPKGEVEASPTVDGLESSLSIYDAQQPQEWLADMFNTLDGLDQPDDDDNYQNVYFTDGLSITRRKENGIWVYTMVDDY